MLQIERSPTAVEVFADCYAERSAEMPRDTLLQKVRTWDVAVIKRKNDVIGAVACSKGEFHFGILPVYRGKWATRTGMKQILEWAGKSGPVRTSATFGSLGEKLARFVGMRVARVTEKGSLYVYP